MGPFTHETQKIENLSIPVLLEGLGHLSGKKRKFIVLGGLDKDAGKVCEFILGPILVFFKFEEDQLCLRITNVYKHFQSLVGELAIQSVVGQSQSGLLFLEASKAPSG